MKPKFLSGQSLVQYLIVALLVLGGIYMLVPIFQEANKRLVSSSAPVANTRLNKEGVLNTSIPTTSGVSSDSSPIPDAPPSTPGTPPPVTGVGECGPNGCGTIDLSNEENNYCGTIPGPAGVLDDGCWICDHTTLVWYWSSDTTGACKTFWNPGLTGGGCYDKCEPYTPPYAGITSGECWTCADTNPTQGFWQKRKNSKDSNACTKFWTNDSCVGSDTSYRVSCTSACTGVPPEYGFYYEPVTGNMACWLCNGGKWINSIQTTYCYDLWVNLSCPSYSFHEDDFPFCGCASEPPARGTDPLDSGKCWICNNGSWIEETDPVKCTDFWVTDNCPESSIPELACADPLPGTPPAGNCYLCTNPEKNYRQNPYDASNPLYANYGEPCNKFWTELEYPGYLDIPGYPDDVDAVCGNTLTGLSFPEPGIVYDPAKGQWGCWLCGSSSSPYTWIYWLGGRFDRWTEDQYQACQAFWIEGTYPASIPSDPSEYERLYEYGGAGYETGRDAVVISNDLFIVGDESSDSSGGNTDITVIKMDRNNSKIDWKYQYGGSKEEKGQAIATDGTNLYVTGYEVSDDTKGGGYDAVVMKLNTSGSVLWKKQYGGAGNEKGLDIAYGDSSIYVTGSETSDSYGGSEDIFVMNLDNSGNVIWKYQYGGAESDVGQAIAFADNSVYVAGYEMSDNDGGQSDVFVMKLDTSGNIIWKKQYGGGGTDRAYSMAVSESYIYLAGYETSDSTGGYEDIFVMKLDNGGNVMWKKQYGGTGRDKAYALAVDDTSIYVTGEENSDPHAGANSTYPGEKDLFIMRLDKSNGAVNWKQQHGGAYNEVGRGIAVSGGYVYAVGEESSDPDGGTNDLIVLSLHKHQVTMTDDRNPDDWTINGVPLTWALNGSVIDEWSAVSTLITGWTTSGDNVNWPAASIGGSWTLEGTTLDIETGPAHEEELEWTPLVSASTPDPPSPPVPATEWMNQYGGAYDDEGMSIAVPDNGYIYVTGFEKSSLSPADINSEIFILKMKESNGQIVWKKRYGENNHDDIAKSIVVPGDGFIYVTGWKNSDSTSPDNMDIFVMRVTEANGVINWIGEYGGDKNDYGLSLLVDGSDLYVAGIENESFSGALGGRTDILLMKLNKNNGSVHWAREYGGNHHEYEISEHLIRSHDRSLAVSGPHLYYAGIKSSYYGGNRDMLIMKVNTSDGDLVLARSFGGTDEDKFYSIAVSGSNIYVCGEEESFNPTDDDDDVFVMKLDSSLNPVWKKQYGDDEEDIALGILENSGYLYLTGLESSDSGGGGKDIFVMKLGESDGSVEWKKQYGGNYEETGNSIAINNNYLYITGRESSDADGGGKDVVVMKIDAGSQTSNLSWSTSHSVPLLSAQTIGSWANYRIDTSGEWHKNIPADPTSLFSNSGVGVNNWSLEGAIINDEEIDEWTEY